MRGKLLIATLVVVVLFIQPALAWEYTQYHYAQGTSGNLYSGISVDNAVCNITTRTFVSAVNGGNVSHSIYIPYNTVRAIRTVDSTGKTCYETYSDTTNLYTGEYFYNSKLSYSTSLTNNHYLESTFSCEYEGNIKLYRNREMPKLPNIYIFDTSESSIDFRYYLNGKYERCGAVLGNINTGFNGLSSSTDTFNLYIPFNSGNGMVNVTVVITGDSTHQVTSKIGIVKYNTTTVLYSTSQCVNYGICTHTLTGVTLEKDTLYYVEIPMSVFTASGSVGFSGYWIDYNITIPIAKCTYSCSGWYPYNLTHEYRECVDIYGECPTYYEYRSIIPEALVSQFLGFENGYSVGNIAYCQRESAIFGCPYTYKTNRSRIWPEGWDVSNVLMSDYSYWLDPLTVTTEDDGTSYWPIEGEASLKMWYEPPGVYPNSTNPGVCGNYSYGFPSEIAKNVNQSIIVSKNITFPTPNTILRFFAHRCNRPQLKWDDPGLFGLGDCGIGYYSYQEILNDTIEGTFRIALYDVNEDETILEKYLSAGELSSYKIYLTKMETSHNYTLFLEVQPEDLSNPHAACVYFDDMYLDVYPEVPECRATCEGLLLYEPIQEEPYCILSLSVLSPACASSTEIAEKVETILENCEDSCIGSDWYDVEYDNVTGECFVVDIFENFPLCVAKEAAEEEERELEVSLTEPVPIARETLNETWLKESEMEFVLLFFTPLFMSSMMALFVGAYIGFKTNWQVGFISILITLTVLSLLGLFPSWLMILIIILAAFVFSKSFMQIIGGD